MFATKWWKTGACEHRVQTTNFDVFSEKRLRIGGFWSLSLNIFLYIHHSIFKFFNIFTYKTIYPTFTSISNLASSSVQLKQMYLHVEWRKDDYQNLGSYWLMMSRWALNRKARNGGWENATGYSSTLSSIDLYGQTSTWISRNLKTRRFLSRHKWPDLIGLGRIFE